ncbi:alpha/beta fold hydrolase [Chromobacterium vaccinii]|uniref:alpha/beta fold hydrolase n=1 Tax=Chromobacterium vaccinii TaxID=1108595 RepID=UPI00345AE0AF
MVLLHGAAADKSSWVRFAKHLGKQFPLRIPDLPGHGDSVADLSLDYTSRPKRKDSRSGLLRWVLSVST